MGLEYERVPDFRRKVGHIGQSEHRRISGIEGVVQRFLEGGEIGLG